MRCSGCDKDKHTSYYHKDMSGQFEKTCKRCKIKRSKYVVSKRAKKVRFDFVGFDLRIHELSTRKWEIGML